MNPAGSINGNKTRYKNLDLFSSICLQCKNLFTISFKSWLTASTNSEKVKNPGIGTIKFQHGHSKKA